MGVKGFSLVKPFLCIFAYFLPLMPVTMPCALASYLIGNV